MRRTLLLMVISALLLTQCRKPAVELPTAEPANTVSMTVTAGPGSKTDITTAGAITWSTGDKLYVGDGAKYIGCLTLQGTGGSATGTFSGDVTLTGITEGVAQTFHFFYLGSGPQTLTAGESTQATVSFAEQTGLLGDLGSCHIGYGTAQGTVAGNKVTGINVTLVSKVALARFSFTESDSKGAYTGALMLGGEHIYNKMTVSFDRSEGFRFTPTRGYISLTNTTSSEKYVMLVPTGSTEAETLNFVVDVVGKRTLESGIESNKFYGRDGAMEVTVKPVEFTVDETNGTKVKFSPGNLYWDGSAFRFEANQWGTQPASAGQWVSDHVSHFKWSDAANAVTGNTAYSGTLFCASDFTVDGAAGWRTLSKDEWVCLLSTRTTATTGLPKESSRYAKVTVNGVKGLLLFPDSFAWDAAKMGTAPTSTNTSGAAFTTGSYNAAEFAEQEKSGVVFLPAAGLRDGTGVTGVGSNGYYWSGSPEESNKAYRMSFSSKYVGAGSIDRYRGISVRLVRSAS